MMMITRNLNGYEGGASNTISKVYLVIGAYFQAKLLLAIDSQSNPLKVIIENDNCDVKDIFIILMAAYNDIPEFYLSCHRKVV